MCGITGIVSKGKGTQQKFSLISQSSQKLAHRGPDNMAHFIEAPVAFGHTRLSIIDLNERSNQPMHSLSGRYSIVFNGEIYNYQALKHDCEKAGIQLVTESDTEVLLTLYSIYGKQCLDKLNGFFAFAIYDRELEEVFVARDRLGIKPLVYYMDDTDFAFASELKALYAFGFEKELDKVSVFTYFKLNYIPAPATILKNFYKLEPGYHLTITWNKEKVHVEKNQWYQIPLNEEEAKKLTAHDYSQSQKVLKRFVRESVRKRLIADVPVGTFLSGGVDSSIIATIAKEEKEDIEAFTIGFPEYDHFDETSAARVVAEKAGLTHHEIPVRQKDLYESARQVLDHLDEPFGDSSMVNVNLLSKHVRTHVKVALSGDGGDELFGGYNKHSAEFRVRYPAFKEHVVGNLGPFWGILPNSRSGKLSNLVRQLNRFSDGFKLGPKDRYWRWAGIMNEEQANYLMKEAMLPREQRLSDDGHNYKKRKDFLLRFITKNGTLNETLLTDAQMVLANDMLFKVDQGSMIHNLEVRTPLLDHLIVQYAFKLPVMFKLNHTSKKKILTDAFSDKLPNEILNNPKKGFEVPLLEWFRGELKEDFKAAISDLDLIEHQGVFNPKSLEEIERKLYSNNPGDSATWAWAYLVFQSWYKNHMI